MAKSKATIQHDDISYDVISSRVFHRLLLNRVGATVFVSSCKKRTRAYYLYQMHFKIRSFSEIDPIGQYYFAIPARSVDVS